MSIIPKRSNDLAFKLFEDLAQKLMGRFKAFSTVTNKEQGGMAEAPLRSHFNMINTF